MFRRLCGARLTVYSKHDQVNRDCLGQEPHSPLPEHIREILNRYGPNLSRDFFEIVEIVLDRSQFNRIISHTADCKGCWI